MADVKILAPFIKSWEGGFVNDPDDAGGATMAGITINTYKEYCKKKGKPAPTVGDLKRISEREWADILKTMYWDPWQADKITCQGIANLCVNWGWGSGVKTAIMAVQSILGLKADGVVGPKTLESLNKSTAGYKPAYTFNRLKAERGAAFLQIAKRGNNSKFLNGWLRRWESFGFRRLVKADGSEITW